MGRGIGRGRGVQDETGRGIGNGRDRGVGRGTGGCTYVHVWRQGSLHWPTTFSDGIQVLPGHQNAVFGLVKEQGDIMHSSGSGAKHDIASGVQQWPQAVAVVPVSALILLVDAVFGDVLQGRYKLAIPAP